MEFVMECFKKLKLDLPPDHKIFKEFKNFEYSQVEVKHKLYNKSKTFKQCHLSNDYFAGTTLSRVMNDLNLHASIFLIEGSHFYNWHRDAWRNITFNLTLNNDSDYLVLFAPDADPNESTALMMYERYVQLQYDDNKFVLLNTQIPHLTITKGTVDRYLLTVAHYSGKPTKSLIDQKSDFSEYEQTIVYLKDHNLLEN
jgi:hypothetical protein